MDFYKNFAKFRERVVQNKMIVRYVILRGVKGRVFSQHTYFFRAMLAFCIMLCFEVAKITAYHQEEGGGRGRRPGSRPARGAGAARSAPGPRGSAGGSCAPRSLPVPHSFRGSFEAESPPIFASKYAFCSIFQNQ